MKAEEIDIYAPNRKLIAFLDEEKIKYVDLLKGFQSSHQNNKVPLFFFIDPHLQCRRA